MTDILFENDHILIRSEYRTPDPHQHLASHIAVALRGYMHCEVSGDTFDAEGICIASDIRHTIFCESGDLLLYLFDTTSNRAARLEEQVLKGRPCSVLPQDLVEAIRLAALEDDKTFSEKDAEILRLCGLQNAPREIDPRIEELLAYLQTLETVEPHIMDDLCQRVCLSSSRLSHLFRENAGISLHRYLALIKMKIGYRSYLACGNITDAALNAGFDSPSHFASTCKRMFGISFSEFQKSFSKETD